MIADAIGRGAIGAEPKKVSAALALATIVTLVVVVPLAILAWQARASGPAGDDGLTANVGTEDGVDLAGLVLRPGTDAEITLDGDDLVAASWALHAVGGPLIAEGSDAGTPPFAFDLAPGTVAGLDPGLYDVLVTGTERDGTVVERAARFAVGDPE